MFNSNPGNAAPQRQVVNKSQLFTTNADKFFGLLSGANPLRMALGDGFIWVGENGDDTIVQYTADRLEPTGFVIDYSAQAATNTGIAYANGFIYVLYLGVVYQYNATTGAYTGTSFTLTPLSGSGSNAQGMAFSGDGFWFWLPTPSVVEKFDLSFVSTGTFAAVQGGEANCRGMDYDTVNDKLYYFGANLKVYEHDADGTAIGFMDLTGKNGLGTTMSGLIVEDDVLYALDSTYDQVLRTTYSQTIDNVFTWTKPVNFAGTDVLLTGIGGGGSGNSSTVGVAVCAAGDGGQYIYQHPVDVSGVASVTVTVGIGGSAVNGGGVNTNGNNGSATSFGSLLTLLGGQGANVSSTLWISNNTGGAFGGREDTDTLYGQDCPCAVGGVGGVGRISDTGGGGGLVLDDSGTAGGNSNADQSSGGKGYGAGGAGRSQNTQASGAGADGALLVTWQETI